MGVKRTHSVIRFNHISKDLGEEETAMLKSLYEHYHMLSTCYKWQYKRLSRTNLLVNMTAIFLTIAGGAFSALGGLATLSISDVGLLVHGFKEKYHLTEKAGQCDFAYRSYSKSLNIIKGHLRGLKFDRNSLFSDLSNTDNLISDTCVPLSQKVRDKYKSTYMGYSYVEGPSALKSDCLTRSVHLHGRRVQRSGTRRRSGDETVRPAD